VARAVASLKTKLFNRLSLLEINLLRSMREAPVNAGLAALCSVTPALSVTADEALELLGE